MMETKAYYAVKHGRIPGIYGTWDECEAQTKGFSGAQYKSFGSMAEAKEYMAGEACAIAGPANLMARDSSGQINSQIEEELGRLGEGEVIAFVDGSYSPAEEKSGYGVIMIDEKGKQTELYQAFTKQLNAEFLEPRNVAVELEGVKEAIKWAIANKKTKIKIYYDYEGIGKWADGSWQAKKEVAHQYVTFLEEKRALIAIEFCKVLAHSGIKYNEMADKLARESERR